jgi:hypothetical protein
LFQLCFFPTNPNKNKSITMKFFTSVAVGIALLSTAGAIALPGANEAAVEDHKHKHHHNGTHSQEIRHWTVSNNTSVPMLHNLYFRADSILPLKSLPAAFTTASPVIPLIALTLTTTMVPTTAATLTTASLLGPMPLLPLTTGKDKPAWNRACRPGPSTTECIRWVNLGQ